MRAADRPGMGRRSGGRKRVDRVGRRHLPEHKGRRTPESTDGSGRRAVLRNEAAGAAVLVGWKATEEPPRADPEHDSRRRGLGCRHGRTGVGRQDARFAAGQGSYEQKQEKLASHVGSVLSTDTIQATPAMLPSDLGWTPLRPRTRAGVRETETSMPLASRFRTGTARSPFAASNARAPEVWGARKGLALNPEQKTGAKQLAARHVIVTLAPRWRAAGRDRRRAVGGLGGVALLEE